MLKALLNSLKGNDGVKSSELGLEFVISNTTVYLVYSLKFDINRSKFKAYIRYFVEPFIAFKDNKDIYMEMVDKCYEWYLYFLDNKTLTKPTSSLKSDLKKVYKKFKPDLKGFDRFIESVYNAYKEANNIYDIVLYEAEAIKYNKTFEPDRGSCFINSRKAYLEAISQSNVYYTMVYKNGEPITRAWLLASCDFSHIAIFNIYGHKFKNIAKFFSDENQLEESTPSTLESYIGVYVNSDLVLTNTESDYDNFIYDLSCPHCGNFTTSNNLEWTDNGLRCDECDGLVYSDYYGREIDESEAVYSEIVDSYLYSDDAVYSQYHDTYLPQQEARRVYTLEDEYDYVLKDVAVYSEYMGCYLIDSEAVYSDYYEDNLLNTIDTVFSKYLNSYIDKNDDNIVWTGYDYIPLEDLKDFIKFKGFYYKKDVLSDIIALNTILKPLKVLNLLKASY